MIAFAMLVLAIKDGNNKK
ncbi:hypothetical protein [Enterococcus sp. C76]